MTHSVQGRYVLCSCISASPSLFLFCYQMQISVEKTIQREIDGQITNIELNGEPSNADDDGSSDARSIKGGFSSSSGGAI